MKEIVTDAVILLGRNYSNGPDRIVSLFTKELGRVEVKAISGYKITSKLSPHLDPLNLVQVRLINKNNFIIADALTKDRFRKIRENQDKLKDFVESLFLIQFLTPELLPDNELWHKLISSLNEGKINKSEFLAILGYSPEHSTCFKCGDKETEHFLYEDQVFICNPCYKKMKKLVV